MSANATLPHIFADLNPGYPAKGQHRWTIFHRDACGNLTIVGRSYRSRRSAERDACILMVEYSLRTIGL